MLKRKRLQSTIIAITINDDVNQLANSAIQASNSSCMQATFR